MTENAIIIKDACLQDVDIISEFNCAIALETEDRVLDPSTVRAGVERILLDASLGRYFVALVDGNIAGQTMVTREWSDWRNGMFWWIQSVYVHQDYRGRGVFKALYEHIESLARKDSNVCGLRLYVEAENKRAIETYCKLGMEDAGYLVYEVDWS